MFLGGSPLFLGLGKALGLVLSEGFFLQYPLDVCCRRKELVGWVGQVPSPSFLKTRKCVESSRSQLLAEMG